MARIKTRHLALFLVLWTLLVLYPNPYRLVLSVARVVRPPVDVSAVAHLVAVSPADPAGLEAYVLREWPYQYDWQTYNVPWYFPTVQQALAAGTGDCKTRFVVLASLFEAKGIPYRQTVSLSHIWVTYEGKPEYGNEQDQHAWLVRDESGTSIRRPQEDLGEVRDAAREAFWDHMPAERKALLLAGPPLAIILGWSGRWSRAHVGNPVAARRVSGARAA